MTNKIIFSRGKIYPKYFVFVLFDGAENLDQLKFLRIKSLKSERKFRSQNIINYR